MICKRFLIPVVSFVALGLPASASEVAYCDGGGCGGNTMSVFNATVGTDTFASGSLATLITYSNAAGVLSGGLYTDDLTTLAFQATHVLAINGTTLATQNGAGDALLITIPSTYTIVVLSLQSQNGTANYWLDDNQDGYTSLGSIPVTVGYINAAPSSPWTITVFPFSGGASLAVNGFNAGSAASQSSDTPEVATLFLIGFGLLSMRWMKRWPRRLFHTPQTA